MKITDTLSTPQNTPLELHSLAGLRILLIEANQKSQKYVANLLQNWQIKVICTEGRQAIHIIKQCPAENFYHAILMDMQIPEIDFEQVTKLICAYTTIPILSLSTQPIEPETLHTKIKECTAYDWFVTPEKRPTKMLADFEAVDEFADGDLAYRTEMFDLYKKFFIEFLASYKESLEIQDIKMLKALTHKARPSVRLMNLTTIEDELNRVAQILEQNITAESLKTHISTTSIEHYCLLCLAHLHIFSPETNES